MKKLRERDQSNPPRSSGSQKIGKPRNGKPHWRTRRLMINDPSNRQMQTYFWCNYKEHDKYELVNRQPGSFFQWIINHIQEPNVRLVYDMVYDAYGFDFETEEDKLQFILKWGYK